MKFGSEFHRLQVPRWADSYLDYDGLKQLAKQNHLNTAKWDASFGDYLLLETTAIDRFLAKQNALINLWFEAVLSLFNISHAQSLQDLDLAGVAQPELQHLADRLSEILDFVAELNVFSEINREAVQRLFEKLGRGDETPGRIVALEKESLLYSTPWTDSSCRANGLMQQVHDALQLQADATEPRSLLLHWKSPVPIECLSEGIHDSIRNDDSSALMCVIASTVSELATQEMIHSVLQVAIVYQSPRCIQSLLGEIASPFEEVICSRRDALHQLIARFAHPSQLQTKSLEDFFRELSPYQHHLFTEKDWRGRYPLHYAAERGFMEVCRQIIKFVNPIAILEPDIAGETPLALAVYSGHEKVVQVFLDLDMHQTDANKAMIPEETAGSMLSLAIQAHYTGVADCFIQFGRGLNFRGKLGQTPLYTASRTGQAAIVESMLAQSVDVGFDNVETSKKWTPLMAASVHGHTDVVRLLLAVADVKKLDWRGWSAIDHASYRAHMSIVAMLQETLLAEYIVDADYLQQPFHLAPPSHSHNRSVSSTNTTQPETQTQANPAFSSVFVNIGTFSLINDEDHLGIVPSADGHIQLQHAQGSMLLEVSAPGCSEQPFTIQSPYLADLSSITWRFSTPHPDKLRLTFKLFQCTGKRELGKTLLGSGVALLGALKGWFRPGRQSLRRDCTIALNSPEGDFCGSVTFTFLVSRPYTSLKPPCQPQKMCFPSRTQVVAHRGLGLNDKTTRRLQIGEHTVQSLTSALEHGADFIEFDVQVTRDSVPVIYHDWLVSETGLDAPIHAMTFRQWMAISEAQSSFHQETPRGRLPWDERTRPSTAPRRVSRSQGAHPEHGTKGMYDRMKHTFEYSKNNMKGNTRGDFIHDSFVTLRQLFEKFSEDVTFDIELKYPMLWECTYWGLEPYWNEMNDYLDAILAIVFELGGSRNIFFSCFNPEVCILLSTKQQTYPVVFLNDSMVSGSAGDSRATSLQQAVRFARRWNLAGVIIAAEPFVAAPRLIGHVKGLGLYCGSYGSLNDVPEFAQMQAAEGIDMLVVNNVRLISMALRT